MLQALSFAHETERLARFSRGGGGRAGGYGGMQTKGGVGRRSLHDANVGVELSPAQPTPRSGSRVQEADRDGSRRSARVRESGSDVPAGWPLQGSRERAASRQRAGAREHRGPAGAGKT